MPPDDEDRTRIREALKLNMARVTRRVAVSMWRLGGAMTQAQGAMRDFSQQMHRYADSLDQGRDLVRKADAEVKQAETAGYTITRIALLMSTIENED